MTPKEPDMKKKKKVLKFLVEVETDKWEFFGWSTYIRLALVGMMIPVTKVTKVEEA